MVMVVPMVVKRSHYAQILGDQWRRVNCLFAWSRQRVRAVRPIDSPPSCPASSV